MLALKSFVASSILDGGKKGEKRKLLELSKQLGQKPSKVKIKTQETLSSKDSKHPKKPALKRVQVGWHVYITEI